MKKRFNRILSLILVLASLLSMLTVFIYAEEGDSGLGGNEPENPGVNLDSIDLVYNRNFEEGWDYNNGFGKLSNHKSYIDFEETATYKYNYFWRIEASDAVAAGASSLNVGALRESGSVVKFKIKADDACNLGRIMYLTTPGKKTINLLYISGSSLYAFASGNPSYKVGDLTDDWLSVALVFDWDATRTLPDGTTDTLFKCRVYCGDDGKYFDYENAYELSKDKGMKDIAIGISKPTIDIEGMSFCIDDLQIYQKTKEVLDLSGVTDHGSSVNPLAPIVVDVQDGPGNKSVEQIINEALCMKIGVNTALIKNEKKSIRGYCTPEIIDGNVMIPLPLLLDFINYPYYVHGESYDITTGTSATYITIGRSTANVDGVRVDLSVAPGYLTNEEGKQVPVIAAADIPSIFPGWLLTYDDMGLVIIYSGEASEDGESLITRENDLEMMLTIMKKFVFDIVTTDENGKEFDEAEYAYLATGNKVYADVAAKSASHPYIFTNQSTFDNLNAAYGATEGADETVKSYLATLVNKADEIYAEYAVNDEETGKYNGFAAGKKPVNEFADGKNPDPLIKDDPTVPDTTDGYNTQGTLDSIETYSALLVDLAFAYQVTGDENYGYLAYDISLALGEWLHWGPGNAVNCATATANFAISYDWLYNFYTEKFGGEAVDALAGILYDKGVKHGYNASMGKSCLFPRAAGEGDIYNTLTTNVNAVCSSGMIIGALALADYVADNDDYKSVCATLIGNNMQFLINNGLDMYAPDGSYAESALMWADATNSFAKLVMALESAAGTTYGFEDTWGIDKTFYFACYIQDSDGKIWNYHEGGADGITGDIIGIDTQMFYYAGKFLNDSTLIAIRKGQLEKNSEVTIYDMLFYPTDTSGVQQELQLDYQMEGIHAFVSRSDWNEGALFTGIMGGANDVYGGQLDSGNFIYRNKGIDWFIDLGSDNPDIYSYFGAYRNHHYRNNAEGQNVILIHSAQSELPYGQMANAVGTLTQTYSNEHGSYAILDNKAAYGSVVSFAKRGVLVTNDRETVVVQDEMSFKKFQEITWVAHTASQITIDSTGKHAYLTDFDENGHIYILRASIVSSGDYSFKVESAENNLLDVTYKNNDYKTNGGIYPYSRAGIQRLVIKTKNLLVANIAVVFELVDTVGDTDAVRYDWAYMTNWMPSAPTGEVVESVVYRNTPTKSIITSENVYLNMYVNTLNTAYTVDIDKFYESLTNVAYALKSFPPETLDTPALMDAYSDYDDYLNAYEKYIKKINSSVESTVSLTGKLSGVKGK